VFDFSTDNHTVNKEQVYRHCIEMAERFEGISGNSIETVQMYRGDIDSV
jgi:hypothetical protein